MLLNLRPLPAWSRTLFANRGLALAASHGKLYALPHVSSFQYLKIEITSASQL